VLTSEDPAVAIARMDGRLTGIEKSISDIGDRMATKEGAQAQVDTMLALRQSILDERADRLKLEIALRAEIKEVRDRLQVVEDRLEARKFQFLIAMAVGALGIVFGLIQAGLNGVLGGNH